MRCPCRCTARTAHSAGSAVLRCGFCGVHSGRCSLMLLATVPRSRAVPPPARRWRTGPGTPAAAAADPGVRGCRPAGGHACACPSVARPTMCPGAAPRPAPGGAFAGRRTPRWGGGRGTARARPRIDAPQGAARAAVACSCARAHKAPRCAALRGLVRPVRTRACFDRGQVRQRSRGPVTGLGRVALAAGSRPFAAPARLPRAVATRRASSPPGCWALRRPAYLSALTRTAPPAGGLALRPSPPAARHGRGD